MPPMKAFTGAKSPWAVQDRILTAASSSFSSWATVFSSLTMSSRTSASVCIGWIKKWEVCGLIFYFFLTHGSFCIFHWMWAAVSCNLHWPETEEEEVAVLSSQSYGGLGKPNAGCGASIFFHNRCWSVADGPIEPHRMVSAICVAVILLTKARPSQKSAKLKQSAATYEIYLEGLFNLRHYSTTFILRKGWSVTNAEGVRAWW